MSTGMTSSRGRTLQKTDKGYKKMMAVLEWTLFWLVFLFCFFHAQNTAMLSRLRRQQHVSSHFCSNWIRKKKKKKKEKNLMHGVTLGQKGHAFKKKKKKKQTLTSKYSQYNSCRCHHNQTCYTKMPALHSDVQNYCCYLGWCQGVGQKTIGSRYDNGTSIRWRIIWLQFSGNAGSGGTVWTKGHDE